MSKTAGLQVIRRTLAILYIMAGRSPSRHRIIVPLSLAKVVIGIAILIIVTLGVWTAVIYVAWETLKYSATIAC